MRIFKHIARHPSTRLRSRPSRWNSANILDSVVYARVLHYLNSVTPETAAQIEWAKQLEAPPKVNTHTISQHFEVQNVQKCANLVALETS